MKEGSSRSGPFGCLIVKKKGDTGMSNVCLGKQKGIVEKKRKRLILSDSESDDEDDSLLVAPKVEIDRKRKLGVDRNKFFEGGIIERKRSRNNDDENAVEERRKEVGRNGVLISKRKVPVPVSNQRELETGCSRSESSVHLDRQRFEMMREKFGMEPIRVQGKNGVLKVMPNNKNKMGGSEKIIFRPKDTQENRKGSRSSDYFFGKPPLSSSFYSETKLSEKSHPPVVTEKQVNSVKKISITHNEVRDLRAPFSDTSLSQDSQNAGACSSKKEAKKGVSGKKEFTLTSESCLTTKRKEGEVKRGTGTEKQLLRERIRHMLTDAGWKIDLRPRKNRNYQDAVYVNPSGTEFWSITKAYSAFQKQFEDDGRDQNNGGNISSFTPIPDDVLHKLTRQTRKKIEREMKMKQKAERGNKNAKETSEKKFNKKHLKVKIDSGRNVESMDSAVMQDGKSLKLRIKGNNLAGLNTEQLAKRKKSTLTIAGYGNGKSKRQRGRALMVRSSSKGPNMGDDEFVPYTGKRTVLSWLIDMDTVPLSGKVQYMNKRRTQAMLEGWITREGIHCGCCSKILPVSKFELHAGSKLHQPFQNIIVENGPSLFQCQLDAWNRQEKSVRRGFHSVDIDGGDPNDDTCSICGDGGNLICCDGCPSTFHQSCLDIQMLPSGEWNCPNCSCKFCGGVDGSTDQEEDASLCSCSLCEEKYHRLCGWRSDTTCIDSDVSCTSFCGKSCAELFQQLQKLLGVKHELEAGFSWTLIQRSTLDSDSSSRVQCQKAEYNAKLAVALTVMDECFLPVTDQRSGVDLIRNVLFNIGSNFYRLNYSGFYTVVLERGDEIISAASIRFHGTRLVEMPFIGTRHIYRRQGMCRRLFHAIESALCSLNVEKLVIPAISELMDTWTSVFGFKPFEESDKQEVKTLNMLVFPSTDLLQKPLLRHKLNEMDVTGSSVVKTIVPDNSNAFVEPDICSPDNGHEMNNEVSSSKIGSIGTSDSTCDTLDVTNNPSDAALGTIVDGVNSDNMLAVGSDPISSSVKPKLQKSMEDDAHNVNVEAAAVELVMHPLDEASGQHTANDKSGCTTTVCGCIQTTGSPVQSTADLKENSVHKVESKEDLCLGESGVCAPEMSDVYDHKMNKGSVLDETGPKCPDGSSYDTVDMRSTPFDAVGPIPDGPSEESSPDTKFFLHLGVDHSNKLDVDSKTVFISSDVMKLQNSTEDDAPEANLEAVGYELDPCILNETSAQHASNKNANNRNAVSGNSLLHTSGNHVQSHSESNVESESDIIEFVAQAHNKGGSYDPEVSNGEFFIETGCSGPSVATHNTSDMIGNLSDAALASMPDGLSDKSAPDSRFLFHGVNCDTKLDVALEMNVEATGGERDHLRDEGFAQHTLNAKSDYTNVVSCNCYQSTAENPVKRNSKLNEHIIHSIGCTSVELCHVVSNASHFEPNVPSTSDDCIEQYGSEGKNEVSAVTPDLNLSDEGNADNQLQDAALQNSCQGCTENVMYNDSKGSVQPFDKLSGGVLVRHQASHDGSYNASDAASSTCKSRNEVAPDKHSHQDFGDNPVDCTSEVDGVLLNEVQLPKVQGPCTCKWGVELKVGSTCCKDNVLSCSDKEASH